MIKMNEAKIYEKISDYIDRNMNQSELEDFEKELSVNKDLKQKVEDVQFLLKNIKKIDRLELPSNFNDKLISSINKNKNINNFNLFKLFDNPVMAAFGSVAAAILIVLTTTVFFSQLIDNKVSSNLDVAIENDDNNEFDSNKEDIDFEGIYRAKTDKDY